MEIYNRGDFLEFVNNGRIFFEEKQGLTVACCDGKLTIMRGAETVISEGYQEVKEPSGGMQEIVEKVHDYIFERRVKKTNKKE